MKHIYWLLILLLVPSLVLASVFLGQHKATETVPFPLTEPLVTAGTPQKPDSCHVIAHANGDEVYDTMNTTWPFTAAGIDTFVQHNDTAYWFSRPIQEVDGSAGNATLAIQVILYTDNLPTMTGAVVQIIADSLNTATSKAAALTFDANDSLIVERTAIRTGLSTLTTSDNIGINWADVANPTTAVNLTQTDIRDVSLNDADSAKLLAIKTATDQLNFTGTDVKATLDGETVSITENDIDSSSFAANAITQYAMAPNVIGASEIDAGAIVNGTEATGFLDSATTSRIVGRKTWGISDGGASADPDSSTKAQRIIGYLGAIDAGAVDASALDATAAVEIAWANWDLTTDGHTGAGTFGLMLESCSTGVAGIKAKTDKLTFDGNDSLVVSGDGITVPQSGWSTFDPDVDSTFPDMSTLFTRMAADSVMVNLLPGVIDSTSYDTASMRSEHYGLYFTTATTIDSMKDTLEDMSTRLLADVSGLATASALEDSTNAIHQKLYFLGLADSSGGASVADTAAIRAAFENWPVVANAVEINDNAEAADSLAVFCDPDLTTDILTTSNTPTASAFKDSMWAIHASEVYNAAGDTSLVDKLLDAAAAGADDSLRNAISDANKANFKATGFATSTNLDSVLAAITDANKANFKADVSGLATATNLDSVLAAITDVNKANFQSDGDTNKFDWDAAFAGSLLAAITDINKANYKADVSALATTSALEDSTNAIHQKLYFLGLSDSSGGSSDSILNAITDVNKSNFKANVSALATASALDDSTDAIHQKLYFMGLSDSSSAVSISPSDIQKIADSVSDRVYDTMYVHASDFKGGTGTGADPLQVYVYNTADTSAISGIAVSVDTKWDGNGSELTVNTNGNGLSAFNMDDGDSLLIAAYQPPWTFTTDSIVKAAGTDVDTIWGTVTGAGTPSSADICSVYCWSMIPDGVGALGGKVTATLVSTKDTLFSGNLQYLKQAKSTTIGTAGYWSIGIVPNEIVDTTSYYMFEIKYNGLAREEYKVYVPDSSTVHLGSLLRNFRR